MKTSRLFLFALATLFAALAAHATINAALQMQLGNPSSATSDPNNHTHYLTQRDQFAMDYNDTTHEPNWVSWDLTSGDVGGSGRSNFIVDTSLPAGFYQVLTTDYSGSGYDRGHMCPSADRTVTTADNQALFVMSNMIPQSPDNNQGVWASFENYCRSLASAGNEILITSGPSVFSGSTIASGVAIPGYTWKIAVVVPLGAGSAVDRIIAAGAANIRVIAIKIPNIAGVRSTPWENFVTSPAVIQGDTGFTFFSNLPASIAAAFVTRVDGQTATGAPVITAQPSGQTAPVGATATFSVTATGDAPLTYQWLKDDEPIDGATGTTLTLTNVQAADVATYTVTVTNAVGSVTSNDADLVVSGLPPTIAEQPTSRFAAAGTNTTFTVTAGGTAPFTYQWRKGGVPLVDGGNISGAATPNLTLTNVQNADTAAYDVVITNSVSTVTSDPASLTVTSAAPTITSQPANRSLAPGSTATFTVVAVGSTPLTYQWRKGGTNINTTSNPSAATSTLSLVGISLADAGSYDVVATNTYGTATSAAASLSISSASATQVFYTGGTYVQDFDTLPNTGTVTLSGGPTAVVPLLSAPINASGAGGWSFAQTLTAGTSRFTIGTGSGNTGSVYSFGSASGNTERAIGLLSSSSNISVFGVVIVNNTGQTINTINLGYTGEQWRYAGNTTGADKLSVEYQIGGTDIATGTFTGVSALDFVAPVSNTTAAGFGVVAGAINGNDSRFRKAVSTSLTGITWAPGQTIVIRWKQLHTTTADGLAADSFSFNTSISGPTGPSVASTAPANSSTNVALNSGIAVTFDQPVTATGSWFALSSATRGALSASVSASPDGKTYTLTTPTNFNFSENISVTVLAANVTSQSTGLHLGADYSFSFTTAAAIAPSISTQPISSQTVNAGGTANFSVVAAGTSPFSYQWRKGGVAIAGNPTANSATLTLTNVQAADMGSYDVIVSNGVGSPVTSNPATLTVTATAPVITTQPVSQTVTEGTNVTLTVAATGTTPFTYQWRRNTVNLVDGGNISGANSATLNLTPAALANGGTYSVVVSNGVGSPATSSDAVLTVNALPKPFTAGNLVVVRVGSGTGPLAATGNPVYLDEFTPAGALVQSIALPVVAAGGNQPLILGGTSTTEGALTRSADAHFLTLGGYATGLGGAASLTGTTSAAVNRVVARVDASGTVNTTTVLSDWSSGSSPRGVTTLDGSAFWLSGGAGGVRYATLGATTSTSVSTTVANLRTIDNFGGQLYVSTQSGTAIRVGAVGTGVSSATGQTMTALPGVSLSSSPNAFFFANLDSSSPGVDTLYVADEGATTGGIVKYSLVNGTWVTNGTITAASVRGITGSVSGNTVTLYASTGGNSSTGGGTIFAFTDTTGYNGSVSGAASAIVTAGANTVFRGVAFAPGSAPTMLTSPLSQLATVGDTVSFSVSASASGTLTYQWRKDGVNLADGGIVSGATTSQLTLTGILVSDQAVYDCVVTNPIGSTASDVAALTVNKAVATVMLGDLNFTYNGGAFAATATTTPASLNVIFTYDGSAQAPVNAGSYAVVATVDDDNYTGSATGVLTIAKATAVVSLDGLSQTYSGAARTVSASTAPIGLTVALTYDGDSAAPVNAGSYNVSGTVVDQNYTGSASGTLVVGKAVASVTLGGLSPIYDGTPKAATATTTPNSLTVAFTYDGGAAAPTNAGSYAVVATVNDANYTGSASGTMNIARAVATVTVGNLNQTYNGSPKPASVTVNPATEAATLTYDGNATAPTNAGNYAVVATVNTANYTGSASGTLVIGKATAGVTLGQLAQVYDGTPKLVTVTTSPTGLVALTTYNGVATAPTNVGNYAVSATVVDPNYTGSAAGTLVISQGQAVITLSNLTQAYDGTPKPVTVTTSPANVPVTVTYDGTLTVPTAPGSYAVVATSTDANRTGSANGTLVITVTALVRHAPTLNAGLDGSVQMLLPESVNLNGSAIVTGDLLVPGAPIVQINGNASYSGTVAGSGVAAPTNYAVTLNGRSVLRHVVNRTNAIAMPTVNTPPAPTGTRDVSLNSANQSPGDFATLRNLTLNGNSYPAGLAVPAGTYGNFTVNSGNKLILGVAGATTPAVYNLQNLVLNGNSEIVIAGPVVINLANGTSLNGTLGAAGHAAWLTLNIASGDLTLNSNAVLDGTVIAPNGTVSINGSAMLTGRVVSDRLTINGSGLLTEDTP